MQSFYEVELYPILCFLVQVEALGAIDGDGANEFLSSIVDDTDKVVSQSAEVALDISEYWGAPKESCCDHAALSVAE